MRDMLFSLLIQAGATTFLLSALVWLLKQQILTRLQAAVGHEYDTRLEEIRANVAKLAAANSVGTGAFGQAELSLRPRNILAVERLWSDTVERMRQLPKALWVADILVEAELFKHAAEPGPFKEGLEDLDAVDVLERLRGPAPLRTEMVFVDQVVWGRYSAHFRLIGRVSFLFQESGRKRRTLKWWEDDVIALLIGGYLSAAEQGEFRRRPVGKLSYAADRLEEHLLREMRRFLSGQEASSKAVAHATELDASLRLSDKRAAG